VADATALRLKHFVAAEYQQDGDGSVQSLPWASSCPSWPLAVCVVACLSSDVGAAERLLRLHSNGLLAIALAASPAGPPPAMLCLLRGVWTSDKVLKDFFINEMQEPNMKQTPIQQTIAAFAKEDS
ncbi:unnamed protein product, partial [Polarella glacialis]